jgi:outer membrane protein
MKLKNVSIVFAFFLITFSNVMMAQDVLTLHDAIDIALENSPQVRRSEINLERSKESLKAQNASLLSKFNLRVTPFEFSKDRQFNEFFSTWNTSETKASYGTFSITQPIIWTDGTLALNNTFSWQDAISEFQGDLNSETFSNRLFLSYNQPLFTYNRTKLQLNELELDLENAALSYAIQKLAITKNVSESFYSVYQQKLRVQIANDEFQSQKTNYELTLNKVDAGILSKDELYQAELNKLNSQMSLQNQEVTLQNQLDQFKQLVGIPIEKEIDIIADVAHNPVEVQLNKALESGVAKRMELRQREIDIESSQFNLIRTSATNEFFGNLSMSVGLIGTDEKFNNIYDTPTNNQQFSLSFDIPLFDWGESESRIEASKKTIELSKMSLNDERISIMVAIRSVARNLTNLETQIEISEVSERNAQLSYEINLERYSNGDLTSIDLQRFQQQLSEAKLNRVNALISYKLELLNMKIQSLYDFERKEAVVPDIKFEIE